MKQAGSHAAFNEAFAYATRNRNIDMVAEVTKFFDAQKKIIQMEKIAEDICPDCICEMDYLCDEGYTVKFPDRDCEPEFVRTGKIYICPECHKRVTVDEPVKRIKTNK